jgi:hypothetical protein
MLLNGESGEWVQAPLLCPVLVSDAWAVPFLDVRLAPPPPLFPPYTPVVNKSMAQRRALLEEKFVTIPRRVRGCARGHPSLPRVQPCAGPCAVLCRLCTQFELSTQKSLKTHVELRTLMREVINRGAHPLMHAPGWGCVALSARVTAHVPLLPHTNHAEDRPGGPGDEGRHVRVPTRQEEVAEDEARLPGGGLPGGLLRPGEWMCACVCTWVRAVSPLLALPAFPCMQWLRVVFLSPAHDPVRRAPQVVLGAYYGTGKKGGLMSTFLMGVYDEVRKVWLTVCKVGNGHDDATLDRLNKPGVLKVRALWLCSISECRTGRTSAGTSAGMSQLAGWEARCCVAPCDRSGAHAAPKRNASRPWGRRRLLTLECISAACASSLNS